MASDPRFGANDPRFDKNPNQYDQNAFPIEEPPRKSSFWKGCAIGCLSVFGVLLLVAVIGGFWISQHWRGWIAGASEQGINAVIDDSELPAQEKVEVKEQVARVTKAFGDGKITIEQTQAIGEKLTKSPLLPSIVVMAIDRKYFDKSKLTDQEKAEGRTVLRRFARGVFDGKIKDKGVDSVLAHIMDKEGDHDWHFRAQVTDADLKAAISDAKAQVEAAGIPEVPENIDPSDEIKRIIDESLKQDAEAAPKQ